MMRLLPLPNPKDNRVDPNGPRVKPIPVMVFPTGLPPGTYRCQIERIEDRDGTPTMIYGVIPEDQPKPTDPPK